MEETTLCGASCYNQKYYFNPAFSELPQEAQEELKILSVEFTEDAGGVFTIYFGEDACPHFSVRHVEGDQRFDEIGAELLIKRYQEENEELMARLAVFYRIRLLGWKADAALAGLPDVFDLPEAKDET
ncbi:MAG: DUF6145 family protein [Lachnospiraceae bacterium]|nr:DUF6145 family protein [Lachnospiraceae bacterium]